MERRAEFGVFLTEECEDRTFDPETRMLPVNKNSGLVGIVAVLACTVLALALYHGVLRVTAALGWRLLSRDASDGDRAVGAMAREIGLACASVQIDADGYSERL